MNDIERKMHDALNKLAKWRTVFASWQLGTRSREDAECQAVKDHRELSMLTRAEVTAVVSVLINKGLVTREELQSAITQECEFIDKAYEKRFPGFSTSLTGVHIKMPEAAETTKNWRP